MVAPLARREQRVIRPGLAADGRELQRQVSADSRTARVLPPLPKTVTWQAIVLLQVPPGQLDDL